MAVTYTSEPRYVIMSHLSGGSGTVFNGGQYKSDSFKCNKITPGYVGVYLDSNEPTNLSSACKITKLRITAQCRAYESVFWSVPHVVFRVQGFVLYDGGTENYFGGYNDIADKYCDSSSWSSSDISVDGSAPCSSSSTMLCFNLQFEGYGLSSHERNAYIKNIKIGYTRTRACYITFKGDGVTETKTMYDYGTVPAYGSTPTRVGYDFVGWRSGGTTYTGALPAAEEQDVTYTAVWTIAHVIMHYIGNGATSGEEARISQQRDINCTLESNWFEKKYAVQLHHNAGNDTVEALYSSANFLGWYTAAEGGERVGGSGDSYTPTNHIDLYAHWSAMPAVTLPTPTRDGYTFLGWYTASEGGTKVGDGGTSYTPNGDITLYAHWQLDKINKIYVGASQPSAIYIGTKEVKEVYVGTTKIYG